MVNDITMGVSARKQAGGYINQCKEQVGPALYASGGFTVTLSDMRNIKGAIVNCEESQVLAADDTMYNIKKSYATNVVTIVIEVATFTGSSVQSWAEIADDTDLSGLEFTVLGMGE